VQLGQCPLQQQELRASMVLRTCCKWCNVEGVRAVPTYFLDCWRQQGPKGRARAALYLTAADATQRSRTPALYIGLPRRGCHRAVLSPWVDYWRSDSEIIQGTFGLAYASEALRELFHDLLTRSIILAAYSQ